jgi:2-oxoglutarate ferredoxin oxidoreductase subunit beta
MFNNRIYGLTKGQYSPTSEQGKVTRSTPYGSVDYPFNPTSLALGSEASFVARSFDREPKHMQEIIKRAAEHVGTAFVEIYQNCNIFNDGAFKELTDKETKDENVIVLEHNKPMLFGKNNDKGIKFDGFNPVVIDLTNGKYSVDDVTVHDEFDPNPVRGFILSHMSSEGHLPTPIGIFRQILKPTYDGGVDAQIKHVTEKKGEGTLEKLLFTGNTWEVD